MKSILVILVLVAFVRPEPCQVPSRLSGDYNLFTYNVDEDKMSYAVDGTMYIDQAHKRTRIEGRYSETVKYKIIQLFEERIQYFISGGHCHSMTVKGGFPDMIIPANASLVSRGRIGPASDGLNIVRYAGINSKGKYLKTVTQKDCVPTSGVALVKVEGVNFIAYSSFTRASMDFDDAVFDVPAECREAHGVRARRSVEGILDSIEHVFGAKKV